MLNDGKKSRGGGQPLTRGRRHGTIIHYRDEPNDREEQEKGLALPGGEDRRNCEWCQDAQRVRLGEVAWGLLGPPQRDPSRTGELSVRGRHRPPNPWGLDLLGRGLESWPGRGQAGEVEPDIL